MNTTTMFGKTYNTIGSTDSNFIIKTKGDLKVLWGGKYIDVIKNGKIASNKSEFFKEIESEDLIKDNGIYLVEDLIWISVGNTKINLTNISTEDMYISFMLELPKITSELKYISLTNAGFYYDSLESAKQANLTKGLIYIEKEHLLYYINNGIITKYVGTLPDSVNKFKELFIGSFRIFLDFAQIVFDNDGPLVFKIKKLPIVLINNNNIEIHLPLIIHGDIIGDKYKLYSKNGLSYLEVDNIISDLNINNSQKNIPFEWIYAENIINAKTIENTIVTCQTIYKNSYKSGDSIYLLMDNSAILSYNNFTYYLSYPVPVDIVLKVNELFITIPKNTTQLITQHGSENYEIIEGSEYLNLDLYKNKLSLWKFTIIDSTEDEFTINLPVEDTSFIKRCQYVSTCLANKPLLTINNEIKYFEKEKPRTIIGNISNINLKTYNKEKLTHGIFSENLISINSQFYDSTFKKIIEYPKYDSSVEIPENVIDSNYDSVIPNLQWIKKLMNHLIPSGSIIMFNGQSKIPEGWAICDGSNGTPNLIGKFIKAVSTIDQVGDNQSNLNENNELIISLENLPKHTHPHKLHTHNLEGNLLGITENSGDLTLSLENSNYNYGLESILKTFVKFITGNGIASETDNINEITNIQTLGGNIIGGNHSHSITLNTKENISISSETSKEDILKESEWPNKPIKIEPRSYSLIFIMKL